MKVIEVKSLEIPEVKIIKFARFKDERGFFSETFRKSDIEKNLELGFLKKSEFVQINESFSRKGVIKGLHFQWDPPLGKLLRTILGHMVDIVLDIRKDSPNFGKIIMYDLPSFSEAESNEWIWIPPGMAHGSFFLEDSYNEYLFTADYNPKAEAGVSLITSDFDWSLCDRNLKEKFEEIKKGEVLISEKDSRAMSLPAWSKDKRSHNFLYENLKRTKQNIQYEKDRNAK